MKKIDLMGFLFTQKQLMEKEVDANLPMVNLDFCHLTVTPPFPNTSYSKIVEDTMWLRHQLSQMRSSEPVKRMNIKFGLQHPPIDFDLEKLQDLSSMGIKFCTLAYELENEFGGGFAATETALKYRGMQLINGMEEATGICLDLSHASHRTARAAFYYIDQHDFKLPVIATHTGCYEVYKHLRNLPDEVLTSIVDRGGIVGIYTLTFGLDPIDNSMRPFLRHVEHAIKLLGEDGVAIGSDGIYQLLNNQKQAELFQTMKAKIDPRGNFKSRFPDHPVELNTPERMDVIFEALSMKFGSSVAEKIVGGNAHRFLSENKLF